MLPCGFNKYERDGRSMMIDVNCEGLAEKNTLEPSGHPNIYSTLHTPTYTPKPVAGSLSHADPW